MAFIRSIFIVSIAFVIGCDKKASPAYVNRLPAPVTNPAERHAELAELLPLGKHKAEWLELSTTPRGIELVEKLQIGIRTNAEWFKEFMRTNAVAGQPLPYDERLGMSSREYSEMLAAMEQQRLVPVDQFTIEITEEHGHRFIVPIDGKYPGVVTFHFDIRSGEMHSPVGYPAVLAHLPAGRTYRPYGSLCRVGVGSQGW